MKVGLVHRDMHAVTRGGICTLYRELAARLPALGHDVTIITQATLHPVELPGVDVITLPRTDNLPEHRRAVATVIEQLNLDIAECSSWEAELLHLLDRRSPARPPVVVRGDLSAATMQAWALVPDEWEQVKRADAVLAVSRFAARDLADAYGIPEPIVIPNGVDRSRFRPLSPALPTSGYRVSLNRTGRVVSRTPLTELAGRGELPPPWTTPADRPTVVWVGKITPMKGWDRLEALLDRLHPHANVTVVLGHSRAYSPVTVTADTKVVILQDLDDHDMAHLYNEAAYLLSTSRWEGFGLAIAEALACGTPALLPAELGTAPELLADGGGHVYGSDDELVELLHRRPRTTGRLPARFDWDANAAATVATYEAVISEPTSRSGRTCASS